MIQADEIRAKIADYLRSEITLDDFDDWFSSASWNMHKNSEQDALAVAARVELLLSEHSASHLTERDLRQSLADLAQPAVIFRELTFGIPAGTRPLSGEWILDSEEGARATSSSQIIHRRLALAA